MEIIEGVRIEIGTQGVEQADSRLKIPLRGGLAVRIVTEVPTEGMLNALTAAGVGVSFVVDRRRKIPRVSLRKVQDLQVELCANAIWRKDDKSPILQKFLTVVRGIADQQPRLERAASSDSTR